jgi:hypothetical protein
VKTIPIVKMKKVWTVRRALDPVALESVLNSLAGEGYAIFQVLVVALNEGKPGGEGCVGKFEVVAYRPVAAHKAA